MLVIRVVNEDSMTERSVFSAVGGATLARDLISVRAVSWDPMLVIRVVNEDSMAERSVFSAVGGGIETVALISSRALPCVSRPDLMAEKSEVWVACSSFEELIPARISALASWLLISVSVALMLESEVSMAVKSGFSIAGGGAVTVVLTSVSVAVMSESDASIAVKSGFSIAGGGAVTVVLTSVSVALILESEVSIVVKSGFSIAGGGMATVVWISVKVAVMESNCEACAESKEVSGEATCSSSLESLVMSSWREELICPTACSISEILPMLLAEVALLVLIKLERPSSLPSAFVLLSSTCLVTFSFAARSFDSIEENSREALSIDGWSCLAR